MPQKIDPSVKEQLISAYLGSPEGREKIAMAILNTGQAMLNPWPHLLPKNGPEGPKSLVQTIDRLLANVQPGDKVDKTRMMSLRSDIRTLLANQMIDEPLHDRLIDDVSAYFPDCANSVVRNGHMNEYNGEVSLKDMEVHYWLRTFVGHFTYDYKGNRAVWEVMMGLIDKARTFRTEPCAWVLSDQPTRDAVLVDFINYVAAQQGMDLGLYTKDILTPETRYEREEVVA